jgi:hypothetical protein
MHHDVTKLSQLDPFTDARAARLLESLDRQIQDASQPPSDWQPVSTAPRDGMAVLVWAQWKNAPAGPAIVEWLQRRKEWKRLGETRSLASGIVTHWMPLPSGPTA